MDRRREGGRDTCAVTRHAIRISAVCSIDALHAALINGIASNILDYDVGVERDLHRFQPIQSQMARPMTSSRSRARSQGSSSVNSVTH